MSTFSAIVTSHDNEEGLRDILGQLLYQTHQPEEVVVLASETPSWKKIRDDFAERFGLFQWHEEEDRGDWGHEKRAKGITLATQEWLGFFNDDDRYEREYIEQMLSHKLADVVYCTWNSIPKCDFRTGSSTSGNFIVRTGVALQAGYQGRSYAADGEFIGKLADTTQNIVKEMQLLYHWNEGVQPCRS